MNILSVEGLSYRWGEMELLLGAELGLGEGEKVALVARNGAGKSTLLRFLVDAYEGGTSTGAQPDAGRITWRRGLRLGYLPQEPQLPADKSVVEAIFATGDATARLVGQYEAAVAAGDEASVAALTEQMDAAKAWDYEARAKQTLGRLNLHDFAKPTAQLSGGQRKRVALANLLLAEPDCLILDEPTNHLDLEVIAFLEDYLSRSRTTLLMVTHDRYFLDRVCTAVVELDEGLLYRYDGGYSTYLQRRQERLAQARSSSDKARNLLRREQEWMQRQPRARGTKAQYRIDAFSALQERARKRAEERTYHLDFAASRLGRKVADLEGVTKGYNGRRLVDGLSYKFARGERVGIIGANGAGKSTLLGLIDGSVAPDSGTVELGETVVVGHYRQGGIEVPAEKTVLEVVEDIADQVRKAGGHTVPAAQFLRQFLFGNELHHVRVSSLSGGERKRLYLVTVLLRAPNLLLLDEPTNDLDILSLGVLEEFLETFAGTVVVVSHDRCFVDRVCDHLLVLDGRGAVKDFPGNYTEWLAWNKEQGEGNKENVKENVKEKGTGNKEHSASSEGGGATPRRKRLSWSEQKELECLEARMPELEARKSELEALLGGGTTDAAEIARLSTEYGALNAELEASEDRWLELQASLE